VFALPKERTTNTKENPMNWEYEIARYFAQWGAEHFRKPTKEINEALVWAAMAANDAYRNKTEDGFEYSVTFETKSGGIEFKTGEGSTPYAAAVELYKKLKGE